MKNLTRREFLKVFAPFAALAAFVLPRPKGDAVVLEVQQNDKALLTGTERASTRLIDNANFDVEPEIAKSNNHRLILRLPPLPISWDLEGDPNFEVELPPVDKDMLAFPIVSWNFEVDPDEIEETANFLDALEDTTTTIEMQAEALAGELIENPNFDNMTWSLGNIEPGATIYFSLDKGNSWEHVDELERLLDSCECAPMEWHIEYKQCESPEWEYVKCPDCGSDNWVWNGGFRCLDCGAEGVDPCIEKGAR